MGPGRRRRIRYEKEGRSLLLAALAGFAVFWVVAGASVEQEAWDNRLYFVFGIPFLVVVAGVLGYRVPNRPWRFGVVPMAVQAVMLLVVAAHQPGPSLFIVGVGFLAGLSLPLIGAAYLGAWLRRRRSERVYMVSGREQGGPPRRLLYDGGARSGRRGEPAFLARPEGAPIYHGFPLVDGCDIDGWRLGAITDYVDPAGCDWGDGFVVAPDGSRAGLVWKVGDAPLRELLPPDEERWGVYAVSFPGPIRDAGDMARGFAAVLPELRRIHAGIVGG
ncbi:MAG: hypothetical protein R3F30_07495 [Planctomycetota bacterium]